MKRSSGLSDKNGREICEGDTMTVKLHRADVMISGVVTLGFYEDAEQWEDKNHFGWTVQWTTAIGQVSYSTLPDAIETGEVIS